MSDDKPFVASAERFLDRAMGTGRYSAGLIREFDAHVEDGTANIFPIFEEIGALDGSKTAISGCSNSRRRSGISAPG